MRKYLLQMIKGIIHQEAIFLNLCEPNSKENFVIIFGRLKTPSLLFLNKNRHQAG